MKSHFFPDRSFGIIEPLEARIAPATIRIGAVGVNENVTDTEYREAVDPTNPARGTRPDPFNSISFVDTSAANDAISLAVDPLRAADGTNTFFLRLSEGDQVDHFTDASNYRPLIIVTKGHVVAFFTDRNGNGEYDADELTGLSLGKNAAVEIDGSVNGDIVTNLNEHKTADVSDDTVDMNSLVSIKQKIGDLKVLGGGVKGNVLSGGDIQAITIAGNVDNVLAGTAAAGTAFHFFKATGSGDGVAQLTIKAGKTGASISNASIKSISARLEAGRGGAGGIGGSLTNLQITGDTDGFQLFAGAGGAGDITVGKPHGGAGGLVTNVFVTGVEDPSPNSPQGIVIKTGVGGDAVSNKRGGAGGKLSNVYVGYESVADTVVTSGELGADSVLISSGAGGAGKFGGKAGGVNVVKVRVRTPDVSGDEITVAGGLGGSSLSPGGAAGKGGSITDVEIRNQVLSADSDILVIAGNGGTTVGDSGSALGGSVTKLVMLGYDVQVIAGDGSDGQTGKAGGSVKDVTLLPDESILTRNIIINAGRGGNASVGNAGNGGTIDGVTATQVDLEALLINSGIAANGGVATRGKGGRGGSVMNVQVTDIDGEKDVIEGLVDLRTGRGGDGKKGGKAGGSFNVVGIEGHALNLLATAGEGGDALRNGKGGAGGGFKVFNFASESTVNGLDVTGTVHAGAGGDGLGAAKFGGAGGSAEKVNLNFAGDVSLIAGTGGNGQVRGAGVKAGAAGAGGSVLSSGIFAGPSVDLIDLDPEALIPDPNTLVPNLATQSSAEIRAGNAGALGGKPANGGSITGDLEPVIVDGVPVPSLLVGLRAEKNVTVVAGNGTHGGKGGDVRNMTYGSIGELLVPTPVGNILVQAGDGSGEARFAGRGGFVDAINGSIVSIPNAGLPAGTTQTTKILGGQGGGGTGITASGKGGSVSNISLSRGGGSGIVLTIQAGDAGDSPLAQTGAAGGFVKAVGISNIDDATIVRSIGAGDGGNAGTTGGKGGGVFNVKVQDHDIGVRTGETYGYEHMGGIFAGVGGTALKKGKAGDVDQISADAIASIVAGRGRVPELARVVSNIYVSGSETNLLLARNDALVLNGAFSLQFGAQSTTLLPAGATASEVKNALNLLPGIASAGGVDVELTLSGGYKVTFAQNGQRVLLTGFEQVPADATTPIPGSITTQTAAEVTPGARILPVTEFRSGQDPLTTTELVPGSSGTTASEIVAADEATFINEVQQLDVRYLAAYPAGQFELEFNGATTPRLPSTATAAQISTALNALITIQAIGGATVSDSDVLPRVFNITLGSVAPIDPDSYQDQPPIFGQFFVPEAQRLDLGTISAFPTGKFNLTFVGNTTPQLSVGATAANIAAALNALPNIITAGGVTVTSPAAGTYDIVFNSLGDQATIDGQGFVQEAQTLTLGSFASVPTGEFRLSFGNDVTGPLPPNATKEQIQAALNLLPGIQAVGNVTVTGAQVNSFSILFGNVGEQVSLFAKGVRAELQSLDLNSVTSVDTGEFTIHIDHFVNVAETIKGTTVVVPTTTTLDGISVNLTTTTVANGTPGANGTVEEQFLDLFPVFTFAGPTSEFYLNFNNQRTRFLPATASAAEIDAALEALPAIAALLLPPNVPLPVVLPLMGAVTVVADPNIPQSFQILFNVNGNQNQITGVGGFREVQTLDTTQVAAIAGGEMFFTLGTGTESTIPFATNSTAAQIDTRLEALPTLLGLSVPAPNPPLLGAVTVTQTGPNRFTVQRNDFGNIPQLFGQGGGVNNRETIKVDLSAYAARADTTFNLTFGADTTLTLPVAADANQISTALNALPSVKARRTDNSGAVVVTQLSPNVFGITYNIFSDQPDLTGLLTRGTGTTVRLPYNASPAAIEAALDAVSLADTIVDSGATAGNFGLSYAEFGDQPTVTTVNYIHEKQKIDVYNVGGFRISYSNEETPILQPNATALEVQNALNALTTIKATGKPVKVTANPDSSYNVIFSADDDQQPFSGVQFEGIGVATSVDGSGTAREIQVLTAVKKGEYNSLFYTSTGRLLGAVVDLNELDSNVFKSFADTNSNGVFDIGVDVLHIGAFVLGDVPIDGLVMAKRFDQILTNVTPEAKMTATGFFDNDNII